VPLFLFGPIAEGFASFDVITADFYALYALVNRRDFLSLVSFLRSFLGSHGDKNFASLLALRLLLTFRLASIFDCAFLFPSFR
jgi:hypothetical protein